MPRLLAASLTLALTLLIAPVTWAQQSWMPTLPPAPAGWLTDQSAVLTIRAQESEIPLAFQRPEGRLASIDQLPPRRGPISEQELLSSITPTGSGSETADVVQETEKYAAQGIGEVLQKSNNVQTVTVQRRSPISLEPYIAGFRNGQIYAQADGAYILPGRRDLDSMLSKIDPALIESATILPGPYGLRYGPGFAYIDVVSTPTPFYEHGYESHLRTAFTTHTNGGQVYGTQTAYGGAADWGYIVSYGIRSGVDYEPGNAAPFELIPSGYNSQNFLGQIGFRLADDSRMELRYRRIDETRLEYAAQIFDLDFMGTDAFTGSWIREDYAGRYQVDVWYNYGRYRGNTDSPGKRLPFSVVDRIEGALDDFFGPTTTSVGFRGRTFGDVSTLGARAFRVMEDGCGRELNVGVDVRYVEQRIGERFRINQVDNGNTIETDIATNLPRSSMIDPGAYAEFGMEWSAYAKTKVGGRLDWTETYGERMGTEEDWLYAFYLTNELLVTDRWTVEFGGGHSQRVPNLIDRYAGGGLNNGAVFLGLMQSGFNRVTGTPDLRKERMWQIDLSTAYEGDFWRMRGRAFHSWIDDYNLYRGELVADPTGARLLVATNAEMVTLTGVELGASLDITRRVSAFGTWKYLEGRDKDINVNGTRVDQSLYGIVPMEGRVGLSLIDSYGGDIWGVEFGARIVDNQDQVARLRQGPQGNITSLQELEVETPGFTTFYVSGYLTINDCWSVVAGVENLFDRAYYEHLSLRLPENSTPVGPNDPRAFETIVYSPGVTPYIRVECNW